MSTESDLRRLIAQTALAVVTENVSQILPNILPVGGTTTQVLAKASNADFDTEWAPPGGEGSSTWGGINGTLANQTDLQTALDSKSGTGHNHNSAYDVLGAAASAQAASEPAGTVATHAAASDPHTGYQKESEKGAANGYASLGSGGLVPMAQLASGTPDGTKFVRDDGTLVVPSGGTHAASHQNGGNDEVSVAGLSGLLADAQTPLSHTHAWADVTGEPTTLAGYGITDGATDAELAAHESDTTNVHGIADTSALATTATPISSFAAAVASVNFNDQQGLAFRIENRTTDPGTPTVGQIWLRTDL